MGRTNTTPAAVPAAGKTKGGAAAAKKAAEISNALANKASAAAGTKKPAPGRKPVLEEDDDDDDSSSSDDDSDSEIGMTADAGARATMKPLDANAPAPPAVKPSTATAASKGKKRKAEKDADEQQANVNDDDDDDEGEGDPNELIDVEFGLYDPRPADYLTLKQLLKDYIVPTGAAAAAKKKKKKAAAAAAAAADDEDGAEANDAADASAAATAGPIEEDFALHELCDAVVSQVAVGSMVKGEGTDEPLGFYSALSFAWQRKYAKNQDGGPIKWIDQFRKYIVGRAPTPALKTTFAAALDDPSTGLLLQSRLINVPPQIVPQLHASLLEDIAWTRENTGEYGTYWNLKQYVMIGRTFKPPAGSKKAVRHDVQLATQFVSPFASKKKQKKAAAAATAAATPSGGASDEYEWLRFEEELYAKAATAQYTFACPFTAEDAAAGRQPQNCVVMLVPHDKLAGIAQELIMMAAV